MDPIPDDQFKPLFESAPGSYLVLSPGFTIVAVSDAYLQATMTERGAILGRNLFDVFPDNPDDSAATGVLNLRASLHYVLEHGVPHTMAIQQYDIRRHDGTFEERYWSPLNSPVFDAQHQVSHIIHNVQDVTAGIKAKDQLKKSENDFQLLVNNVKDYAIFLLDKNGCVASWNKGAENIKGYTAEEIIGQSMEVFYSPEDIQQGIPAKNLQITLREGHLETEGWRLRKNGSLFYANIVFTSLVDERGSHYGYAKVTKDITEKRKDEERIRLLASITSNIQDPVIASDNDFLITRWNAAAEQLLEWTADEVRGKTTVEVLGTIYPYQGREEILAIIAAKGIWQGELLYHTKSGSQVNVIATASKLKDADGRESGNLILVRDITDRKRAEEKLREFEHFFNNSNDLSCIANQEGYFEILNPSFEKVLGYSQRELSENPFLDFVHPEDIPATLQEYEKLKSGAPVIHFFNRYRKKDGGYLWFDWNATPNPATGKLYCIARDITDRKKAEEALHKLNEELECKVIERTEAIKRSEKQYRYLFENNPMPMWVFDAASFRFLDVNEMATLHYGYSREEFLSMTALDIRPDEDKNRFIEFGHARGTNSAEHNRGTWNHKKKDGTIIQVEIIAHDIIFEGVHSRLILANDVTEKKRGEEKLVASEKRFRAILENNNDIISLLDQSFKVIYRSPSASRIMGWTDEEMMVSDGTKNIHPDDRELAGNIVKELMDNPNKPINCLFRNMHKNGHYLWLEGVAVNLLQDKYVNAIVFNFRDVTERIEAEEKLASSEIRFRSLIENSAEGITLTDRSFNTFYRSPSALKIIGDDSLADLTRRSHPENLEALIQARLNILRNPGLPVSFEGKFVAPRGGYHWLEGTLTNLFDVRGVEAVVANFRDVTKRKEAEERLTASEKQFRNTLDNMLEGIQIHDFNWRYIYVNDALAKYSKSSKDKLIGYTLMEKYPGIEQTALFKTMKHCMDSRESEQLETEFIFPDGSKAFYQLSIQPVPEGIFILSIDITERRQAEQEHIRSEGNLKAIFDNASEGFMLTDAQGTVMAFNEKAGESVLRNITGEVKPGMSIFDFTEESRKSFFKMVFHRVIGGETIQYDRAYTDPGDNVTWIDYIFNPVKENGLVKGLCITGRDITTAKLAEQQKEFDRNNLHALINNTGDLIWSVDRELKLITSNEAFDKLMLSLTGTLIQKGQSVLIAAFSKRQLQVYKSFYRHALAGESFTAIEHSKTPEDLWSEIFFYPIYEDSKVIGTACFSRNITERKMAEIQLQESYGEKQALAERMGAILNTLPANIALLDQKGNIIDVNDSWRSFADGNGFFGENYCIGENYISISRKSSGHDKEDGKKVALGIKSVLAGRLQEFVYEYACHSPNMERWFRMVTTPLQEKEYTGAVVMHIDISELRRLEQERIESSVDQQRKLTLAILQGQEKERNHLGRELHDNINQILAATRMFLSTAAKKNELLRDAIKYPLELLDSSIQEIRTLCRGMVTPLKNIHLQEMVADLLAKLGQDGTVETKYEYSVSAGCLSDDLKLNIYRIMQEVVNNIQKYAGATKVNVSFIERDNILKVTVRDNGKGFKVDEKRKGIGISNMINRMQSFNGNIEIRSSEGKGCQTTITVPC